jgi:hypothetical protein
MPVHPVEDEFEDAITERLEPTQPARPHVQVPSGHFAVCTYLCESPEAEPCTELMRAGQIVPATLKGGYYQFESGLVFRLAG